MNKQNNQGNKKPQNNQQKNGNGDRRPASRGAAIRAHRRSIDDANKLLDQYAAAIQSIQDKKPRANKLDIDDTNKLKITFLGGQDGIGEKNMQVIEWQNDAIILDCGNNLGLNLPGVNYSIADPTYLETIKHKLKGYVISHGHLDHLGGLKHVVPRFPAPVYGSRFTIGVVEKTFEEMDPVYAGDFELTTVVMNMDNHERLKIGAFTLELVRVTHSVPESSAIVVDTPVGRIINTGDFRLDPEPLDHMPSDIARLKELGKEGVLALMSESTYSNVEGRQLTEHTLQQSFHDVIGGAEGRVFVAIFSSNMNRVQMIINAAVEAGRRVALDGRSMMSYAEIAVRQGILKIPKGTVLSMREMPNIPEDQVLVVCTGGQGEPNAALQRMAEGNHKHINLKPQDTVIVSSTPIPGNEIRYQEIGNELVLQGVHLFRQPTHEIDGCGPLHVGGHARRDEHREMMNLLQPKFFIPIYAGAQNRRYHAEMAIEEGWPRKNVIMANNGDSVLMTADKWAVADEQVPHGSLLVDQTGAIVSSVVVKDRVMLSNEGLVAVVLTIDKKTGSLMTSPDIISRGFIYMKDQEELMNAFRIELKRAVGQRFRRIDLDRFKLELKDHVTHFLYEQTGRSPIVIPVVNIIGSKPAGPKPGGNGQKQANPEQQAADAQKRFAEMRSRLLNQDAKID
jgi:ribonuclease J